MIRTTILLIALGLAAAGCASASSGGQARATTPAAAPGDEQAVRATIDRYWRAWSVAGDPPDPAHPDLLAVTTGDARDREVENLRVKRDARQIRRLASSGVLRRETRSVTVVGDTAVAVECVIDDVVVYEAATGRVVNGDVATALMEQRLVRWSSAWQVESSTVKASRPGAASCDGLS